MLALGVPVVDKDGRRMSKINQLTLFEVVRINGIFFGLNKERPGRLPKCQG